MKNGVHLLLGSNLGDREDNLLRARNAIENSGPIVQRSSVYQTEAWGNRQQSDFLNQVIEISFYNSPQQLLNDILKIEKDMGRARLERWGPRIIDIDILFFGTTILNESDLIIPHQQIPMRRFTLLPLTEIAAEFVHPILNKTCKQLLTECTDHSIVNLYKP